MHHHPRRRYSRCLWQAYEPIYRASLAMAPAAQSMASERPTNRRKRSDSDGENEGDEMAVYVLEMFEIACSSPLTPHKAMVTTHQILMQSNGSRLGGRSQYKVRATSRPCIVPLSFRHLPLHRI